MNWNSFAVLTRSAAGMPSRRDVLRGLFGASLGLGAARLPAAVVAKKKRKKSKKVRPNAFGCLSVGAACKNADQCCSGVCAGKKCRPHDTGTCQQDLKKEICLAATVEDVVLLRCGNNANCACHRTTADSRYCAALLLNEGDPRCADCKTDADCVALGYPPEAACAPVSQGLCAGACPSGMACLVPCGVELPAPETP